MTRRRGKGEGSVYFDERKALWVGVVDCGLDASGKRRRKYVRAKKKQEALAKMQKLRSEVEAGLPVPDKTRSTSDYLRWWCQEILPGSVKESTATDYEWVLEKYVIPAVGRRRLVDLRPEDVQAMLRAMEQRGLSPRTAQLTRAILRRALGTAERYGFVSRNVAALTDSPRVDNKRIEDALTADEASAVLKTVAGDRLEALAVVVLNLGLRKGEALALRWDDVAFDEETITVCGTLKNPKGGGWRIDTPKSRTSKRVLPLTPAVLHALQAHHERQVHEREATITEWTDHGFVFATRVGTPTSLRNAHRWWHGATQKAGIGARRFHAARHTTATLLHEQGVPLEVISAVLGHASLAITADVYTRIGEDVRRSALQKLEITARSR